MRRAIAVSAVSLFAACTLGAVAPASAQDVDAESDALSMQMSKDACKAKDFAAFFGSYAQNRKVRDAQTAALVEVRSLKNPKKKIEDVDARDFLFNIQMLDYSYYDADSALKFDKSENPDDLVDVKVDFKELGGDKHRIDWTRAQMKPDDEGEGKVLVKTIGKPGAYIFEYVDGCYQLTQDLR